jgi:hypothetical protein
MTIEEEYEQFGAAKVKRHLKDVQARWKREAVEKVRDDEETLMLRRVSARRRLIEDGKIPEYCRCRCELCLTACLELRQAPHWKHI